MTDDQTDSVPRTLEAPALELRGVTKCFGPVVACDAVDLVVRDGEIHGLLGENGAGKSTLMKVLLGLVQRDEGVVLRHGKRVEIPTPQAAVSLGLGMVHQHFSLIEPLTVWENVILGEPGRIKRDEACDQIKDVGARYGLPISPTARVEDLSAGERQRVEIIKCLRRDPEVLILDEPTSVLTMAESQELFEVLRDVVAKENRAVILISHKLAEIMAATDHVTVLRKGSVAFRCQTSTTTPRELAKQMVGREVSLHSEGAALGLITEDTTPADTQADAVEASGDITKAADSADEAETPAAKTAALALDDVVVKGPDGRTLLDKFALTVAPGEILALYGVEGNGQATLGDLLSGLLEPASGTVSVNGDPVPLNKVGSLHKAGVGVVPEDRHRSGVVLDMSVLDNLVMTDLGRVSGRFLLKRREARKLAAQLIEQFNISTPSMDTPLRNLSGGNQQRVVLARELSTDPSVLVAAQPTHGLDVGAIEDMYDRLRAAASRGVAVLLITTELEEVMALASRVAVISSGRMVGVLDIHEATAERLGMLVGGEAA
ncbi:ABC transporter ATP-binding protein [Cryptosporangium aurantiacum]|uniref:Nucleoside ABC transporter ATP-binding protein n=1 Tax=Cryptosporangium aurantiacum TaxID=134849 RepID=A0A1M7MLJ5_9ACTN|nr:ABC transporter ATP-binding protein [Cryptosporangium aurantiacum]SHM91773.1 nucleoside ABC transporter ATP-binding protein [Cryptosporangium aurantiacum]